MKEVAERAGVSLTTVSHVINQTRFVSEGVTSRVKAAMQELDYRPNELARSLRRGQTNTIGLILPDSSNPYFAEIGQAIESYAYDSSYSVILGNTSGKIEKEDHYIDVFLTKQVAGIIFVAAGAQTSAVKDLLIHNFPVVLVDRDLDDIQVDAVLLDNYHCGYMATEHLIKLGHQCIGLVSGPFNLTPSAERIVGYKDALNDAGLECDDKLMIKGNFNPKSGYEAANELLTLPNRPTAIFAMNDLMAIGVIRAVHEQGLKVPDDLAIVGFDDIELASYTIPPLTTIAQPTKGISQQAVELLTERIDQPDLKPRRIIMNGELVVRGTCGAILPITESYH
jgi:LacI family transcriptional regulator